MLFKRRNAVHCTVLCYVWFGKLLLYCNIGLYWYFKSIPINTGQYSGFDHTPHCCSWTPKIWFNTLHGTDFSPLCSPVPLLPLFSSVDFVKWSSQGMLRMSPDAMNSLFKPTIDHIIQHLSKLHWSFPQHLNTHTHTHTQVVSLVAENEMVFVIDHLLIPFYIVLFSAESKTRYLMFYFVLLSFLKERVGLLLKPWIY